MRTVLFVLVLAGCADRGTPAATSDPVIEPMTQDPTHEEDLSGDEVGYLGVLAPRESAEVLAPFTSVVTSIDVKLGDSVDHGAAVGRLDDRPLREELAIANATLKESMAKASQAVVQSKAAHAALAREQKGLKENIASKAEVMDAQFKAREAGTSVAGAAASVEEQKARIAKLQAKLTDTSMLAPLAGKIALIYVQPGDRVEEGRPVMRVISSDTLFVKFAIPADHSSSVKVGDPLDIACEALATRAKAVVKHVAPGLDPISQMILGDADLVDPPKDMQSGAVCRITPRK